MPARGEPDADEFDGGQAGSGSLRRGRPGLEAGGSLEPPHEHAPTTAVASVADGLRILSLFSRRRPWWSTTQIAGAIDVSSPDACAQVSVLRRMNLMQEGTRGCFGLGCGAPDPMVAIRVMGIVRLARAHLVALQRLAQCPVTLAMLDGTELVVVDRAICESSSRSEAAIDAYRRLPAHATALGKVLLAYQPEQREQALVTGIELRSLTPFTITDRHDLLRELQCVRRRALAVEDREHLPYRRSIAAPVRGAHNRVIAAVGITMLDATAPLEKLVERHCEPISVAAAQLSIALRHAQLDDSDLDWPRL
jgi:IclR family transcriptional regulator, pca regulon regulatory protein